jgi:hypothetical protein
MVYLPIVIDTHSSFQSGQFYIFLFGQNLTILIKPNEKISCYRKEQSKASLMFIFVNHDVFLLLASRFSPASLWERPGQPVLA